jgi:GTP-binding protein
VRFLDEVRITVVSGDGGDGCSSFRREKYIPYGGPDGGDGGRGGDVVFVATRDRNTLLHLKTKPLWEAERGAHGKGKQMTGRSGTSLEVEVPIGTRVFDAETKNLLADLTADGERWIAAQGGSGGLGNMRFKSSTNRTPRERTPGKPGEERTLDLELMLMADVGLLGFPNAGKSTLVSRLSAARPRIADYPFTTLEPSLGVVDVGGDRSFVMADIPGLIEGSAEGAGLGHQFLRHLGRTRLLVHLVSLSPIDGDDVLARYRAIRAELEAYGEHLAGRPELVVLTKLDAVDEETVRQAIQAFAASGIEAPMAISPVTGTGLSELKSAVWSRLQSMTAAETPGAPN